MPRRGASVTQADIARIIRAAKQAGAAEVVINVNGQPVTVRLKEHEVTDDVGDDVSADDALKRWQKGRGYARQS